MRIQRNALSLAALALAAGACGGGGITNSTVDLEAGSYALQTINAQPLPFLWIFLDASNKLEFVSGNVTISASQGFVDATEFRLTEAGVATTETEIADGSWSQSGSTVTFTPDVGDPYSMTWNGSDRLTQVFEGLSLVYLKQ